MSDMETIRGAVALIKQLRGFPYWVDASTLKSKTGVTNLEDTLRFALHLCPTFDYEVKRIGDEVVYYRIHKRRPSLYQQPLVKEVPEVPLTQGGKR